MKTVPNTQYPVPSAETLLVRHRREPGTGYWYWVLSTGYWILGTELPLFLYRFFLGSEARFDGRADASQHVLGWLSELTLGLKLKILLKGLGCTFGRDHLIALERSFADQVHALPVVRVGCGRFGGNHFVECHKRIIHLARIGQDSARVEQVRAGVRGVQAGRLVIVGHGIIGLVGLRISFG